MFERRTPFQIEVAMAWLSLEMDRPSRDNFYQMQTAAEVQALRAAHGDASPVDANAMKLGFRGGADDERDGEDEVDGEAIRDRDVAVSKAKMMAQLGMEPERIPPVRLERD